MSSPYLSILCLFLLVSPPFNDARRRIKLKMIHIDSPESPYRMKYDSPEHKDKVWEEFSERRFSQIYRSLLPSEEKVWGIYRPDLTVDPSGVFLASLGVGTPAKQQFLAVDTGSTITWVTCVASRFLPGNYNYLNSTTSKSLVCGDDECQHVPSGTCSPRSAYDEPCGFQLSYVSSTGKITGPMLTEDFTFFEQSPAGENITEPWIIFGCGFPQGPLGDDFNGTGVMGLSNGFVSLANQLGPSFSYCIGNVNDELYPYNMLILGEGIFAGYWTPILYNYNKIFVSLQTITIDGEVLPINQIIFQRNDTVGGTVIDSGSAITYLADEAYNVFRAKMEEKMKPDVSSSNLFCIEGLRADQVPKVQIIFDQGANLTLGMKSLFRQRGTYKCLYGIKPTSTALPDQRLSLIGINAQQFHNIGYDTDNRKMYIQEMSCDHD